jgi:Uma2 family endonuclease
LEIAVPTAFADLPDKVEPPRKKWTRSQYESLSSLVAGDEKLELVEGELITKMGKKRPHVNAQVYLNAWLIQTFGFFRVQTEAPIDVAPEDNHASEPEPDLVVTRQDVSHFHSANPGPADLLLVAEIADTTLSFDLTTKAALCARAAILEYWVVDVRSRRLIVHRSPEGGRYTSVAAYGEHESVSPLAAPQAELPVRKIFGS